MQETTDDNGGDHAPQVCRACKARKRKCDKVLPACSSCVRRNVICQYGPPETDHPLISAPVSDLCWLASSIYEDRPSAHSIDYATMLFLDPKLLRHGQVELAPTTFLIPEGILQMLGDLEQIHRTAAQFFAHIHLWLPFISKKRFYDLHLRPSYHLQQDVVLLLLSLKLITTTPPVDPRNPRTTLYRTVKYLYFELENSGIFSILILQAGVVLALYEIVHAIHPAAFLSVGACARYAHALGINVSRAANMRKVLSLVEVEERRRVWWAIVILDRFVSIGSAGRPFATKCPQLDDLLPTNDQAWDRGVVKQEETFAMSHPLNHHMTKYALLCQAATLLGQVLQYIANDSLNSDDDMWVQLERTLKSMLTASEDVDVPDEDQMSLIYSALVALYTPWASADPAPPASAERSRHAKLGLEWIITKISDKLLSGKCFAGRDPEDIPPWGHYFSYQATKVLLQNRPPNPHTQYLLEHLRNAFTLLDVRWSAAGIYLQFIEAQQVNDHF